MGLFLFKQTRSRGLYYEHLPGAAPRRNLRCRILYLGVTCASLALVLFTTSLGAHMPKATSDFTIYHEFDTSCVAGAENAYLRPHTGEYVAAHEDEWTWERIAGMVKGTNGFYVRDWPLQLGWNNMRYNIEAGVMHASILNRTLVIPSYIYARACLFSHEVCSNFAQKFERGVEVGWRDFGFMTEDEQIAWRVPIALMLDLDVLRRQHSVITVAEYLRLQKIDPKLELWNGTWSETVYHGGPSRPTLHSLSTEDWDTGFVRVDREIDAPTGARDLFYNALHAQLGKGVVLSLGRAQTIIRDANLTQWADDAEFLRVLNAHGWSALYTFRESYVEMFKAVTEWHVDVAPRDSLRGLVDELANLTTDVVHIRGETHWNRKAGQLRFTTEAGRTHFTGLVLHGIHPIAPVRALGERLAERMLERNGGRQYMAAHMRRGDFAVLGWTEKTIEDHTTRVKSRIADGLSKLKDWARQPAQTIAVPGIPPDTFGAHAGAPREGDKFFLATDATSAADVTFLRENGAVLLADLLESEDQRLLGWPAMFGDVRAQVEQEVATRAAYFYGHSMSSVAGGIANLRAARGRDPRTCYVD